MRFRLALVVLALVIALAAFKVIDNERLFWGIFLMIWADKLATLAGKK